MLEQSGGNNPTALQNEFGFRTHEDGTDFEHPFLRRETDVIEELTDFAALVRRVVIMELELEATLNRFVVAMPPLPAIIPLIGRGVRHAFGITSVPE